MISIRQLTKHYGANPVLRGIDLDVAAGEFVVVLGQSGAGKSTLLRCINRLVQADSGTLSVAGIDALACRDTSVLRRQAAMIFQHHNVVPRLSVLKNVLTGCLGAVSTLTSILQLFRRDEVALAMQCLERVELAHKAGERTDALSGGQMQRVGIARALAQRPKVILADEPVASLDPKTARLVLQYLRDATRELGITVLCNLHQVEYAREFGDRIVGLAQGKLVYDGTASSMTEDDLQRIYPGQTTQAPSTSATSGRTDDPLRATEGLSMKQQSYLWTVDLPRGPRGWLSTGAIVLAVILTLHWSAKGAQLSVGELAAGLPQIGDFLARTVPPDLSILPRLLAPAVETLQIAIWGTLLGVLMAIPLSFLAARNLSRNRLGLPHDPAISQFHSQHQ